MVKDIISSRRENVRRTLPRNSLRSDDGYSISSHESSDMINEVSFIIFHRPNLLIKCMSVFQTKIY